MTFKLKCDHFKEEVIGFGCWQQEGTAVDDPG